MSNLQKELEDAIIQYNETYRLGESLISDEEYDELRDHLKSKYPDSHLLNKSVIESAISRKQPIPLRMASLEKKKTVEEIVKWGNSIGLSSHDKLIISPKWDGISLCVNEKTGDCWTRGDGSIGQYSKEHYSYIGHPTNQNIISFGEAIMPKDFFKNHWSEKYSSPRNLVAGLFNRDEATTDLLGISYIRYGSNSQLSKSEQLSELKRLGKTTEFVSFTFEVLCNPQVIAPLNQMYQSWSRDYAIDGLVIEVNDFKKRESVGRLENGNPNYAVAFKNPEWNCKFSSLVKGIERNVSKQGKVKPVILIEPIDIDGVIVSRVTGYNAKYIINNEISEGAEIEIVRSGEVIPKHIKTLKSNQSTLEALMDDYIICPSCGEPCKWDETMTEIVCVNTKCEGIQLSKLEHFFTTIGVEEFGRPSIESLYKAGYTSILRILKITREQLSSLEGCGESSADIVLNQFEKLRNVGVSYSKKLHALDIFEGSIGEKTIQLIFDNIDFDIYAFLDDSNISDLTKIKGVAEKTASSFIKGLRHGITPLPIKITYIRTPKKEILGDSCKGMKVCFTGVRDSELEEYIKNNGGEIVSGVSKTTTHLIVKDMSEATLASSKSKKAQELNITIQTINQFKQN